MDVFAVPLQGAAIPPAALLTQVGDSTIDGVPSAFLMLVEDVANPLQPGQVMCFHRVTKFPARLLGSRTPWDNQYFAFLANNHGPQISTVHWKSKLFAQANNGALLRVPMELQADECAFLVPPPPTLGPYQNDDAGTKTVWTCCTMIVPPQYIWLFLNGPLSPVVAYQQFCIAVLADGNAVALLPLSTWLSALC
jgi:hypothetical protein